MKPLCSPRTPLLLAAVTLLLVACSSGPNRKALLEEARHSIPPMAGDDTFFEGQVAVHLTLVGNMSDAGMRGRDNFGGKKGGMGVTSARGSGREMGAGGNFDADERSRDSRSKKQSEYGSYDGNPGVPHDEDSERNTRRWDTEMPPALLRLRLENTTAATVVVQIREFNSELGNFAIRPDTLTLGPNASVEPDPVQSVLGVESFLLPVTVTLRSGGKTETKVINLHVVKAADSPPASPR